LCLTCGSHLPLSSSSSHGMHSLPPSPARWTAASELHAAASVLRDPAAPLVLPPPQGSLLLRPDREAATASGLAPLRRREQRRGRAASRLDGGRCREPVRGREQREGHGTRPRGEGGAERQGRGRGRRPRGREGEGPPNCARRGATCRRGSREGRGRRCSSVVRRGKRLGRRWKEAEDDDRWDPRASDRGEELL
jgi:hypothetical protein